MKNKLIRVAMVANGLKQYELAKLMNIHEASLSRKMREELPEEEQQRIVDLIQQHAKDGERHDND